MKKFSASLALCVGNSPVTDQFSSQKCQWRGALMFPSMCAWINACVNNWNVGELRHHRTHYDVTAMFAPCFFFLRLNKTGVAMDILPDWTRSGSLEHDGRETRNSRLVLQWHGRIPEYRQPDFFLIRLTNKKYPIHHCRPSERGIHLEPVDFSWKRASNGESVPMFRVSH